jgi:hypothetical protein
VVQLFKGSLCSKRRFAGLRGVIKEAVRRIEEGEHAVTHELVYNTTAILNSLFQYVEVVAQVAHQLLGQVDDICHMIERICRNAALGSDWNGQSGDGYPGAVSRQRPQPWSASSSITAAELTMARCFRAKSHEN